MPSMIFEFNIFKTVLLVFSCLGKENLIKQFVFLKFNCFKNHAQKKEINASSPFYGFR